MPPVTRSNTASPTHARAHVLLGLYLAASGLSANALQAPAEAADSRIHVAGADAPADPECLTVTQSSAATYMIENKACPSQSVLASIELAGGEDHTRCFVKKIRTQISIASEGGAPVINYQCIEGAEGCSVEVVRDMFPECRTG